MATTVTQLARTDRGLATNDLSTERIRPSVADGIALLNPNENPFTLMSMKLGKISIGSTKRSWLTDVIRPEVDQVNNGGGYTAGALEIIVDNISYFAVGDVWRVFDSGESLLVTTVTTGTSTITVTRAYGGASGTDPGAATALLDDDYLQFIGNSLKEGDTSPAALHTLEVQYDNYTQIQRTVLHLTNTQVQALLFGEQNLPYEVKKKSKEHMRKLEWMNLYGGKPSTDTTEDRRSAGGLFWWIDKYSGSNRVVSTTTLTESVFLTWLRHCFRFGSPKKVLFAPPLLLEAMSRWAGNHLQIKSGVQKFGVSVNIWHTPHGEVAVVNHKMLEGPVEGGGTSNDAFVVDMDDVRWCYLRGRDTAFLPNRQLPDADAKRQEYLTEGCIQIKNFKWHGHLKDFTGFAA